MARAPCFSLALWALLAATAGAIVVREPPTADATQRIVASQGVNATDNASGVPFLGTTVTLALTKALDPVAVACKDVSRWTLIKLTDIQDGINQTKEFPDRALKDFADRFSILFGYLESQLATAITSLSKAGPALDSIKTMMKAVGYEGAIANIDRVLDSMSERVQMYQNYLTNSTEICDSLKKLERSDWKEAGQKLHRLKINLDQGAKKLKAFGTELERRLDQAIEFLASKLDEKPEKFDMVKESATGAWRDLEGSADRVAEGLQSSAQMLPPEFVQSAGNIPSGAAAAGCLGAAALAAAAALAL